MPEGLSIKRNMLWNSVGSIIKLGCNYLITIAVVRLSSGYDAAGALSLAMSISNLVMPLADFRLHTVQVTDTRKDHSAGAYIGMRLLCTMLSFIVGLVYSLATCSPESVPAVLLYLLVSLVSNVIEGMHAVDQCHLRMDYIGKSYIMQGISNLVLFCTMLLIFNSLEVGLVAMLVATIAILCVYDIPKAKKFEIIRPAFEIREIVITLSGLALLVFAQMLSSAVLTVPRQYLASSMGASALGIYSSVASPTVILQVGASYIYGPLLGIFAKMFSENRHSALLLMLKATLGILAVAAVCSLFFLLFGNFVLELFFGSEIVAYSYLLQPALLCTFATAYSWFLNDLLLTLRDYRACFIGNATAAIITLLVYQSIIDAYGLNGASWTGCMAYSISTVLLLLFFIRAYKKQ